MKRICIVLISLLAFSSLQAQNLEIQKEPILKSQSPWITLPKTPSDTVLMEDFFNIGSPQIFTYNPAGYVFGTNWRDHDNNPATPLEAGSPACGQGYIMPTGYAYFVESVVLIVHDKLMSSSSQGSSFLVSVNALNATSNYTVGGTSYSIASPGTELALDTVEWADIITNTSTYNWIPTVAQFNNFPLVNTDYAVVADFSEFYTNGDTLGFFCSALGGGNMTYGEEFAFWKYPNPSMWVQFSHLFTYNNNPLDVIPPFFPVISFAAVGVEEPMINGMRLKQNFPNPVKNGRTTIEYGLDEDDFIEILLIDVLGKDVQVLESGLKAYGNYSLDIDISSYPSGTYYYTLSTSKSKVAKKLIIE